MWYEMLLYGQKDSLSFPLPREEHLGKQPVCRTIIPILCIDGRRIMVNAISPFLSMGFELIEKKNGKKSVGAAQSSFDQAIAKNVPKYHRAPCSYVAWLFSEHPGLKSLVLSTP